MSATKSIIMLGSGGHAKVLFEILELIGASVIGYLDLKKNPACPHPYLGSDSDFDSSIVKDHMFVNGIGSIQPDGVRNQIFDRLKSQGFHFATLVHPHALVARNAQIGEGTQIMAGAIVQAGVKLGSNAIVNTGAIVDHDCIVEDHVHIAPGATLSGGVYLGQGSHVGTGAVIIQGLRVESLACVGAGSVVTRNVAKRTTVYGVPARTHGA